MFKFLLGVLLITEFIVSNDSTLISKEAPFYSTLSHRKSITVHPDFTYTHVEERRLIVNSAEGLNHAYTRLSYDKLNEVRGFDLELKDLLTGKTLKKAKLKDMGDVAAYSYSDVLDDNRYKYYELATVKYPVEVLIRTEMFSKTNYYIPTWFPILYYNQKVLETTYTISYPSEFGLKYKEINLSGERTQTESAGVTTIKWIAKDLPVLAKGHDPNDVPTLLVAPVKFAMDQYHGEMGDWAGLALWNHELNKGRDELPDDFKVKIQNLVAGADDSYEKIKILYGYLQKNFRYVSIQLGIGGWQTMTASDVIKYAYGDCKALTNLMKSMLKEVGIASNYTLVKAGPQAFDIQVDIPANQFNHVILQVPTAKDPVWLECTSNLLPAGFLGDFTRDRHVLVTNENGGFLTKTPAYDSEEWNLIQSETEVVIDPQGNASIHSQQRLYGNFSEEILSVKSRLDERQQRDFLNKNSSISGLIVKDYHIEVGSEDSLPQSTLTYSGVVQKFTQSTAKRVVLKSFFGKLGPDHLANKALKQVDEYRIELPEVWQLEGDFPTVSIEESNFTGLLQLKMDGKTIYVRREISIKLPEKLKKEQETELLKKINSAFDRTILFSKPTLSTTISPTYE